MTGKALALIALIALIALWPFSARQSDPAARMAAQRLLPVPTADVSPQQQALIAGPLSATWNIRPADAGEWRQFAKAFDTGGAGNLPSLRERMGVRVEPTTIAGVKAYEVTPKAIAPENAHRLLINFHGGGYVFGAGEAGTHEAIMMASIGGFKVIAVDYRMAPDAPFPAALDDAIAVWREVIKTVPPENMAMFGTSAGGGLTLATILRLKDESLPLPAAIAASTPWADLAKVGDSYFTNEGVDNVLVAWEGLLESAARLYAGGRDLKTPYLSPIYGDFTHFPPTIVTTGTRDLFLSNSVRTHRRLRRAGARAELNVYEGMSHSQFFRPDAPETHEVFTDIARFFDRNLGR